MSGRKAKLLRAAVATGQMAAPLLSGFISSGRLKEPTQREITRAVRMAKAAQAKADRRDWTEPCPDPALVAAVREHVERYDENMRRASAADRVFGDGTEREHAPVGSPVTPPRLIPERVFTGGTE